MLYKYIKQLNYGCKLKCNSPFCNLCDKSNCIKELANILNVYGDIFLCKNINNDSLLAANEMDKGCMLIDFYFYIIGFIDESECYKKELKNKTNELKNKTNELKNERSVLKNKTNNSKNERSLLKNKLNELKNKINNFKNERSVLKNKECDIQNRNSKSNNQNISDDKCVLKNSKNIPEELKINAQIKNEEQYLDNFNNFETKESEIQNCFTLNTEISSALKDYSCFEKAINLLKILDNHIYCRFINDRIFTEPEIHVVEGVLYLFLEKFSKSRNYFLRAFIIRLFTIVCRYKQIKQKYSSILVSVFIDLQSMCEQLKQENDNTYCSADEKCLINPIFNIEDYKNVRNSMINTLENFPFTDIRDGNFVEDLLNIFKILYLINENIKLYDYEDFYLHNFCRKVNIIEEYKFYKKGAISVFKYSFIMPLSKKSAYIKYENSDLVKESLQETFFRALFEGEKVPYFYINVSRGLVYSQMLRLLKRTPNFDLRKQVKVCFLNEEGLDQGGIKKEFFQLLSEEIVESKRLFEIKNNILWFKLNVNPNKSEYEAIGKIIGIALYNNVVLNLPFPTLFFKRLINKDTDLDDLRELDADLYSSLTNLLDLSVEELESACLNFTINYETDGCIYTKRLIKNGENIYVNFENRNYFIETYSKQLTLYTIEPYMKSIRRGFLHVIHPTPFDFLHPRELEKIIVGSRIIDIKSLQRNCAYRGFSCDDDIPKWFWQIVETYDLRKKKKLLQFVTGNDRVQVTGNPLRIILMKNGCDTERLPSAQTCFNILMLPEYSSKEKLEMKLNISIEYTKGFYLI